MNDTQFNKAELLRKQMVELYNFIYAIDKNTIGTIGHTGICKIKIFRGLFSLFSQTNNSSTIIEVPKTVVIAVGELAKAILEQKKKEYEKL